MPGCAPAGAGSGGVPVWAVPFGAPAGAGRLRLGAEAGLASPVVTAACTTNEHFGPFLAAIQAID